MSNNPPPYPPAGGQQPYGPPAGGGQPPYGPPAGGYPSGPPGPPVYGAPYGPPGQAGYGAPVGPPSKRWYQRWWVWLIIVIVVIVVGLGIYSVGHVSKYQLQDKVKSAFAARGITVTNVHCPDGVSTDKGTTTSCTGVISGQARTFAIRFDSDRHFLVTGIR